MRVWAMFLLCGMCAAQSVIFPGPGTAHSSGGGGAIALVQAKAAVPGSGASVATAFTSNTAAGNSVLACGMWAVATAGTLGSSMTGVTDTQSLTYTVIATTLSRLTVASNGYSEMATECAWAFGTTAAADTVTCTFSESGANLAKNTCAIYEVSGANHTAPVDQVVTGTGTSTNPSIGAVTTTATGEIVIAALANDNGGFSSSAAGTGWTINTNEAGGGSTMEDESRVEAATGTFTGNFTNSHSGSWAGCVVSFKP